MTTSEMKDLTIYELFRAVGTLKESDKIFAVIKKGCKNVDLQGGNERFEQRYRQIKKNFFSDEGEIMKTEWPLAKLIKDIMKECQEEEAKSDREVYKIEVSRFWFIKCPHGHGRMLHVKMFRRNKAYPHIKFINREEAICWICGHHYPYIRRQDSF